MILKQYNMNTKRNTTQARYSLFAYPKLFETMCKTIICNLKYLLRRCLGCVPAGSNHTKPEEVRSLSPGEHISPSSLTQATGRVGIPGGPPLPTASSKPIRGKRTARIGLDSGVDLEGLTIPSGARKLLGWDKV